MRNFAFLAISASLILSLAACGDDDDDTGFDALVLVDAASYDARVDAAGRIDASTLMTGLDCQGIFMCAECCADDACFNACVAAGTSTAQTALNNIETCYTNNCATICSGSDDAACQTCLDDLCGTYYDACGFEGTGSGECADVYSCLGTIEDDYLDSSNETAEVCLSSTENPGLAAYEECFHAGSQAGVDNVLAFFNCIYEGCYDECYVGTDQAACTTCMNSTCSAEMTTCGFATN